MKKLLTLSIIMLAIVLSFAINNTTYANNEYTVTVNDSSLSSNQTIIFNAENISPGFTQDYNVHIKNQSSKFIQLSVDNFHESSNNTLSVNDIDLIFKYQNTALLNLKDSYQKGNLICISPNSDDFLSLQLSLDPNLGNEYQDRFFEISVAFRAEEASCKSTKEALPYLPNTGENRIFYYLLGGATALFALTTVIFLILFIITKKRDKDAQNNEENRL